MPVLFTGTSGWLPLVAAPLVCIGAVVLVFLAALIARVQSGAQEPLWLYDLNARLLDEGRDPGRG